MTQRKPICQQINKSAYFKNKIDDTKKKALFVSKNISNVMWDPNGRTNRHFIMIFTISLAAKVL